MYIIVRLVPLTNVKYMHIGEGQRIDPCTVYMPNIMHNGGLDFCPLVTRKEVLQMGMNRTLDGTQQRISRAAGKGKKEKRKEQ